jgi:RNA polymerase sigma factor (sigma-70 family)
MQDEAEATARWISKAQAGDKEAFDWVVRRFQDMAVAYAFSILGDYQLAQDAAQEAFVEVYRTLPSLRAPLGFAGWLRKIVFKHCDRLTRGRQTPTVPIETAENLASSEPPIEQAAACRETYQEVQQAIYELPEGERLVIGMFYMGGYSHQEIAEFLDISASLVKSRLHQGRGRLKERMLITMKDDLHENRPSRDDEFLARVNKVVGLMLASEPNLALSLEVDGPIYALMGSILTWAIGVEASDITITLQEEAATIEFTRMLQGLLSDRIKMAAEMELALADTPQEGLIPILRHGVEYDAFVSSLPTERGEKLSIRFVKK